MCSIEAQLCCSIVEEFFGPIVKSVVWSLCNNGFQPLRYIVSDTKLKINQVRKSLCILIQHNLARFEVFKHHVRYNVNVDHILSLIFYPKIIYTSKLLYGDAAELIVEEVLHHGICLMSVAMTLVEKRLQNFDKEENLREKIESAFKDLVQARFLKREPEIRPAEEGQEQNLVPTMRTDEDKDYEIPTVQTGVKRKASDGSVEPQAKRTKVSSGPVDDGIYWSVNISRYKQFFRDQAIVIGVTRKYGSECGEIVRAILRISEVTTSADAHQTQAISAAEVSRSLAPTCSLPPERINQHLRLLSHSSDNIVALAEDGGAGGSYTVNLNNASLALASSAVVTYIEERFGTKSCRIFRLLLQKKHLEQKQVEEFAMIPSKEAKESLYNMLSENFLTLQEVPRTVDHAPSRTFYLYSVNMAKISRTLLMKSYKTIFNMMTRQKHTESSYKRLLDKRRQIDAMKAALKEEDEEQLQDIEEMLSSTERGQLEKHEHCTNKLINGQLQIVETVFVLSSFLKTVFVPHAV